MASTPAFTTTPTAANVPTGNTIATANTAKNGTGTVVSVFTAGASGAKVDTILFRALGTNVATVARVFLNNGSTNATAANNVLIGEITLTATTLSEVAALPAYEIPINRVIPAGYEINITIGTTVAAGYAISAWGADL